MAEEIKPKPDLYGFYAERGKGETTESMVSRCYEGILYVLSEAAPDQLDKKHTFTLTCGPNEQFASMKLKLELGN